MRKIWKTILTVEKNVPWYANKKLASSSEIWVSRTNFNSLNTYSFVPKCNISFLKTTSQIVVSEIKILYLPEVFNFLLHLNCVFVNKNHFPFRKPFGANANLVFTCGVTSVMTNVTWCKTMLSMYTKLLLKPFEIIKIQWEWCYLRFLETSLSRITSGSNIKWLLLDVKIVFLMIW